MKQKIKEALQQEYKNLGLNDEAFEGVAAFGETFGVNEDTLANFVKGAKEMLKKMQSDADKARNGNKQVEELKAKLAEAEAKLKANEVQPKEEKTEIDIAKLLDEKLNAVVNPLLEKINTFEATKTAEDALNQAKTKFFSNKWTEKYDKERDLAWKYATKDFERSGKKMTADELFSEVNDYFNDLVSNKGGDISKPFENEGEGDKEPNFEEHKRILQAQGLIPKEN